MLVTLVFTQLARTSPEIAGVRVVDVFVGAAIGIAAGLLAWPRGAGGELRRSAARFLAAGGDVVRETAQVLTAPRSHAFPADASAGAAPGITEAMVLADAAYGIYQTERHGAAGSIVDWQAVMTAGHHIVRGSELLRDIYDPGSLAPWRTLVNNSASKVRDACGVVAKALYEGRDPRMARVALITAPDALAVDVQSWFDGVAKDLTRLSADAR